MSLQFEADTGGIRMDQGWIASLQIKAQLAAAQMQRRWGYLVNRGH